MRKFKLRVGLDADDVLFACNEYAVKRANDEYQFIPPIKLHEIRSWGETGTRTDVLLKYYSDPMFYERVPLIPGAEQFVRELQKHAEVFICTSVPAEVMSARAKRLLKEFPTLKPENIIIGSRKDLISLDVLLDDGAHNVTASKSAYPVLMRRPWNQHMSGCLSVNNYEEFLTLIETLVKNQTPSFKGREKKLVCIVGPSGSGKKQLARHLARHELFIQPMSFTTSRSQTSDEYITISEERFRELEQNGRFLETTVYADQHYGCIKDVVFECIQMSDTVMVVDICGAMALKRAYPDNAILVYADMPKAELLRNILKEDSDDEKVKRLLSIESEEKNEDLCDITLRMSGNVQEDAENLLCELEQF